MAFEKVKKVFDIFRGRDPTMIYNDYGYGTSYRSDQPYYNFVSRRSIVTSIYNRIAVDVAAIDLKHVRLNAEGQYEETMSSTLNDALTLQANMDQSSSAFVKELVLELFDKGCAAIVPTYCDVNPEITDSYNVIDMRVGTVLQWYPRAVKLEAYREEYGRREQIVLEKRIVPIIYNPFYEIMNEPNSTLQRLMRTINQLEKYNDQSSSGKLDMIIQLPYKIRSDAMEKQAESRRKSIEKQLTGSKYGIAYADATEKIIQLNRSLENDLSAQVRELQTDLYNQLGLTQSIFDGTADETTSLNYYNSTVEPILSAITEAIERTWLTKTARTQGQAIRYFRNPFKLIPVNQIAEMSDKLTRNEIMSSNEIRSILGLKPSKDPKANELRNSNLNHPDNETESDSSNNEEIDIETLSKQINIPIE